jgi:multidrug efflux pump subunit AcrA (membrane-fusion protein)
MKLKLLKRRFGAQARRVAIRPHVPWHLRWFGMTCGVVAVAALLWLSYHYGQSFAGFEQYEAQSAQKSLAAQNVQLETANATLKSELAVLERQLQIERATHHDLGKQVKVLSHENSQLKEDIALLQTISSPASKLDGISVSSVKVEPNPVPGEYTYRIVLVQTGSRSKPFQGRYQLVVNLVQNGKRIGMSVPETPESGSGSSVYKLDFRLHQRIDGTFKVAPGAEVQSVQVRVFEGAQPQPKIMQTVAVS